jgi:hypothetical protein
MLTLQKSTFLRRLRDSASVPLSYSIKKPLPSDIAHEARGFIHSDLRSPRLSDFSVVLEILGFSREWVNHLSQNFVDTLDHQSSLSGHKSSPL